jgi:hypothetical protein
VSKIRSPTFLISGSKTAEIGVRPLLLAGIIALRESCEGGIFALRTKTWRYDGPRAASTCAGGCGARCRGGARGGARGGVRGACLTCDAARARFAQVELTANGIPTLWAGESDAAYTLQVLGWKLIKENNYK